MEKLFIVGEDSPGLYLAIPSGGFRLPEPTPVTYSSKTPNRCMAKVGIDRYPFRSISYRIEETPVVSGHGCTLYKYYPRPEPAVVHRIEQVNAIGDNQSRLAIGTGGYVRYYTASSKAFVSAFWIRPGSGGWYVVSGSATDSLYISYYCHDGDRLKRRDYGCLPVNYYTPVDKVLSAIYGYIPKKSGVDRSTNPRVLQVDRTWSGIIPDNLPDKILSAVSPTVDHDLGKVGFDLISQFKITDVNLPAFFIDAPKFGESTKDVAESLHRFFRSDNIKSSAKNLSKANLAYQYGDRLTVADSRALIESLGKLRSLVVDQKPITAKSMDKVVINQPGMTGIDILRYTASASPADPLSKGVYWLSQVANYSNVWDLIPFSFVVDWFLNIGDYLASEDAKVLNCTLKYDRILSSRLLKLELNQFELEGSLLSGEFVFYDRQAVDKVPEPDIDLQASLPRPAQWINGTSLLTSLLIK